MAGNNTDLDIEVYDQDDRRIHLCGAYRSVGKLIVQVDTRFLHDKIGEKA